MISVPIDGRPFEPPGASILLGIDGNAFFIMGKTLRELRKAGASKEYCAAYEKEATSGDYDHLLQASMKYLDAE